MLRLRDDEVSCPGGATRKGAARKPGGASGGRTFLRRGRPGRDDDTPRSLRRCDPDQVPRDCLNPVARDTPGGCITKLANALAPHQCPGKGQVHRNGEATGQLPPFARPPPGAVVLLVVVESGGGGVTLPPFARPPPSMRGATARDEGASGVSDPPSPHPARTTATAKAGTRRDHRLMRSSHAACCLLQRSCRGRATSMPGGVVAVFEPT